MNRTEITFRLESPEDEADIEIINEEAFGPGRFARAAYQVREGGPHDPLLSFIAAIDELVVGSVRLTPIVAGSGRGHLLGPLAVTPHHKNKGIGKKLVALAVEAARTSGSPAVLLVGDAPYYKPLGFRQIPAGQVKMPRPVDPSRFLIAELIEGGLEDLDGKLVHESQSRKD